MPTVDISVPMIQKKVKDQSSNASDMLKLSGLTDPRSSSSKIAHVINNEEDAQSAQHSANNTNKKPFRFVVMTKKGNKPQYHNMEVPVSCEFAKQFKAREEVCWKLLLALSFFL
jgi:hypothetical protein